MGGPAIAQAVEIGIGDQAAETLSDSRFMPLGITAVRIVLPWNIVEVNPSRVTVWLRAVEEHGGEPYVALGAASTDRCPGAPCVLPSDADYRGAFTHLHQRFPSIRVFTAWNEPNHAREPTARDPAAAAHFADIVAEECPHCTVVAGDVLDAPGMAGYLEAYTRALTSTPAVWGLHNYYDTTYFEHSGTDAFLAAVDGRVWMSESGGIVTWRSSDGRVQLPYDEQRAAASLSFGLSLAAQHADRIERMYVYQWRPGPADDFDAGLVRGDGSERPGLGVLRNALRRPLGGPMGGPVGAAELAAIPTASSARVRIISVHVGRTGRIRIRVRCDRAPCRGRLTVAGRGAIAERLVNGRTARGTLRPRRRRIGLRAGGRTRITIRIPGPVMERAASRRARGLLTIVPRVPGEFIPVARQFRFPRSLHVSL